MQKTGLVLAVCLAASGVFVSATNAARADPAGHITGVGGIFFKSRDPKALRAWYQDVLGIHIEDWGGAKLSYDAPGHPPEVIWTPFKESTTELAPSSRDFMVNFAVDDMDAFVARLTSKGVKILSRSGDQYGKFAAILDPDGTKIEFWEPGKK